MNTLPKLFSIILNDNLDGQAVLNDLCDIDQVGFLKGYRVEDNILLLLSLFQQATYRNAELYFLFIDLRKAYDSLQRSQIVDLLGRCLEFAFRSG